MQTHAPSSSPTRDRLIEAAARVFARDGLTGATTRAIAQEAGLNEVTLFRHFRTKERLLAAVVRCTFGAEKGLPAEPIPVTGDLRADLLAHARAYEQRLQENLSLTRAMIGEIHHHGDHERDVFQAIFRPLRSALIARLEDARAAGKIRADLDPVIISDLFTGMIFTGVLRRSSTFLRREYSAADYLGAAVDFIVRGATPNS